MGAICFAYNDLYLVHYGVKGMKWGVRHDPERSGVRKKNTGKKYVSAAHAKSDRNYQTAIKVLAATTGVAAAAVVGTAAFRMGLYRGNSIMKAGTVVQNVAYKGRDFSNSFYGTRDKASAAFFKRKFTQQDIFRNGKNRNTITEFASDIDLKIAGRKEMDKALREISPKGMKPVIKTKTITKNGRWELVDEIDFVKGKMTRADANNFWHAYGRLEPDSKGRSMIENHLHSKGFSGFKDYNDITIGWGNTPTVFFGEKSGLKIINQKTLSEKEIKDLHKTKIPQTANGRVLATQYIAIYGGATTGLAAIDTTQTREYNNKAYKKYGKSYKQLDYMRKSYIQTH